MSAPTADAKTKMNVTKIEPAKTKKADNTTKTGARNTKSISEIPITKKN